MHPEVGQDTLDPFLESVLAGCGLDPAAYRPGPLQRRLPACLRAVRARSSPQARQLVEDTPALLVKAANALLIGVSDFFRDPPVFDTLANRVLPRLLRDRSGLRVLSAGCADGQELYSIAILLAEAGALEPSDLLGVDCRPTAIERAASGCFSVAELKPVADALRRRYFIITGAQARVAPRLQVRARWQVRSLAAADGENAWDMILFRNVAMYLAPFRATGLWQELASRLRVGGVLVTGKAERPPGDLPLRRVASCVYEKMDAPNAYES